jgi:membrane protease subunit (stomatin/prohibitin family)
MSQNYVVPNIYQDMSNQYQGYFAFRFCCQNCSWSIETKPQRSTSATASTIIDAGAGLLGGFWSRAAEFGEKMYGSQWHKEQANALQLAWQEISSNFHTCPKCHRTVCQRCYNIPLDLCVNCAPDIRADGAQFQHQLNVEAQRQQIEQQYHAPQFNVGAIPSAVTPDMLKAPQGQAQLPPGPTAAVTPAGIAGFSTPGYPATVLCPNCRSAGKPGKFCQDCGTKLPLPDLFCPKCASPVESTSRFCPECGTKLHTSNQ